MDSLARRARTAGRWAWQHFRLLAGIALVVGLALTLAANREALAAVDWTIEPLALGRRHGAARGRPARPGADAAHRAAPARRRRPPVATLRIWARSFLLRYEPSGAVGFVYRVRERERLGATTPQVLTATGYEQLAAVTAGALVAVAAFAAAGGRPPLTALLHRRRAAGGRRRRTPGAARRPPRALAARRGVDRRRPDARPHARAADRRQRRRLGGDRGRRLAARRRAARRGRARARSSCSAPSRCRASSARSCRCCPPAWARATRR